MVSLEIMNSYWLNNTVKLVINFGKRLRGSQKKAKVMEEELQKGGVECVFKGLLYNYGEMPLGIWGRFMVMAVGGFVVVLAVIIVACFVGPGCWGYEHLLKEKKKKLRNGEKIQPEVSTKGKCKPENYWLENPEYAIYETGPSGLEKKISEIEGNQVYTSKEKVFNLKCAPLLVAPNLYSTVKESGPKLEVKLSYRELGEEGVMGRLTVNVISASHLPHRKYIATLNPYVILEILNNKWSLHKSERIVHVVQTQVVKNSTEPIFEETFAFDVRKIELKNWCLKMTIVDNDRLTKATPLFEKRIYIKEMKNLAKEDHVSLNLEMQEMTRNNGALLFGISYLPTSQRLNLSVMRAIKLKYQNLVGSLSDFYPYVRVVMLDNHGKCIRKKKTCFRHGEDNPIFNQSLIFDLSFSDLEKTAFLVLLCTKALGQISNSDDSSLEGDIETSLKENKDKVLGMIVLGRNVKCTRGRDHWVTVMQNPRKMVSVWHDLS